MTDPRSSRSLPHASGAYSARIAAAQPAARLPSPGDRWSSAQGAVATIETFDGAHVCYRLDDEQQVWSTPVVLFVACFELDGVSSRFDVADLDEPVLPAHADERPSTPDFYGLETQPYEIAEPDTLDTLVIDDLP